MLTHGHKIQSWALASDVFKGATESIAKCLHFCCGWLRNNTLESRSKRKVICFILGRMSFLGQVIPFVLVSFRHFFFPPCGAEVSWHLLPLVQQQGVETLLSSLAHSTPTPGSSAPYYPPAGGGPGSDGTSICLSLGLSLKMYLLESLVLQGLMGIKKLGTLMVPKITPRTRSVSFLPDCPANSNCLEGVSVWSGQECCF